MLFFMNVLVFWFKFDIFVLVIYMYEVLLVEIYIFKCLVIEFFENLFYKN